MVPAAQTAVFAPPRTEPAAHLARNPVHSQRFRTRNPASTRNGCRVEIAYNLYAPLLVLVEALTSGNASLALVNLLLEKGNNATLYGL